MVYPKEKLSRGFEGLYKCYCYNQYDDKHLKVSTLNDLNISQFEPYSNVKHSMQ